MLWSDCGYLLSKNKVGENSIIAEFFTKNHGKISLLVTKKPLEQNTVKKFWN